MSLEDQILKHMLETNKQLGIIQQQHENITQQLGDHTELLKCVTDHSDSIEDLDTRVEECEVVCADVQKAKVAGFGILTGIAMVAGSASSWLRDFIKNVLS